MDSHWSGKTMVTLGDSITWQDGQPYSGTTQIARGYQTIIRERLGICVINQAVSGRPMANGTRNGDGTNKTGKALTYDGVDLILIAAGTNDFRLDVPIGRLGRVGDTEFDAETFIGAYRDLIEYILTDTPTLRVVLFTPLQRDNSSYDVNYTNSAGHRLIEYVDAIAAIGEMYGAPVCDMYRMSGFTQKTLGALTRDGLHPNDLGYLRMGEYATSFLLSI